MYLTCLLINIGENPDHPHPGRIWIRNLYHVHQRLCMAFPSASRLATDADFLKPWKPEDFPEQRNLASKKKNEVGYEVLKHVHITRDENNGFLYRIDPQPAGRVVILVQSASKPDWEYAFHNADYLLAANPEVRQYNPCYRKGEHLRFRLLANPTKRLTKNSIERDGQVVDPKWAGKRVPVPVEQLFDWLARRDLQTSSNRTGFSIEKDAVTIQAAYIYVNKSYSEEKEIMIRYRSVRYDGILTVTDPISLRKTISSGIGSAKGFGFGLLSLARG